MRCEVEFNWVRLEHGGARPPFHLGTARFRANRRALPGWGRDRDPAKAYAKTIAELWERHACTQPTGLFAARGVDLEHALDPRSVVDYLPGQYSAVRLPFSRYSATRRTWWKNGFDYASGAIVPVTADLVYLQGRFGARGKPHTAATTSGVAAFPGREGAIRRATLELVERDAFMAAWLRRRPLATIAQGSLPRWAIRRLDAVRTAGARVVVKLLDSGLAPVVLLFGQHERRAFTVIASRAHFDPEAALEHALFELESMVYLRLERAAVPVEPGRVRTPADHGNLYAQRRYFRRADFLGSPGPVRQFAEAGRGAARRWPDLLGRLRGAGRRVICVDLSPPESRLEGSPGRLRICRAIVPGLLPISFGCGHEPLALPRVKTLLRRSDIDSLSRGEKTLFPHPFS